MDEDFFRRIRNFGVKAFLHLIGLVVLVWIVGALMAYFTNEATIIGLNFNAILAGEKWTEWLISSWSILDWDAYGWIKLKLLLCAIVPLIISVIIYIPNFHKIRDWEMVERKERVYGNAAWATQSDIKKAKLRCKEGMLLGVDKGGYFVADGFQHALLFAPTGAGKGVGFVIPNLLFWNDSVVVHDIKLENHILTSGWRAKQGQLVYVWEPSNPDGVTHCYNPIDWVSNKPGQMVDDVQKISSLIMPKQEFWENEARSLFLGVMLYLIADPTKPKSFGEAVRALRSDDVVYNFAVALDTLGGVMHPVGYMNLAAFLQKADQERSGVVSTLNSGLELWANPLIDAATASSDFNVLEFKKKKHTVYVGLTPDNIARLQKLMQVFYQQSTEFLSRKMPNLKEEPYGVMFLLDEFPTLGKMEQFKSGIAYFRGYRVRLFLIIQDTQQLKGTYEEAGMNSFLSNSTFRITFAANNYETANLISQLCGNKTVDNVSRSKPQFFDLNPATRTMNVSEVSRALLLPQEVIQLPRDEQIILIESQPAIRSKKIFYYQDKFFTSRLLPPTFVPTQKPYDPRERKEAEDAPAAVAKTETPIENTELETSGNNESTNDEAQSTDIEFDGEAESTVDDIEVSEEIIDEDEYDVSDTQEDYDELGAESTAESTAESATESTAESSAEEAPIETASDSSVEIENIEKETVVPKDVVAAPEVEEENKGEAGVDSSPPPPPTAPTPPPLPEEVPPVNVEEGSSGATSSSTDTAVSESENTK